MAVSGKDLELQNDMERGYFIGLCDSSLDKYGIDQEHRYAFLQHGDVRKWESRFLLAQVLQYVMGVRDERLHDVTCSTLGPDILR